ncbi:MAG TPA: hypothetical protein VK617_08505 [Gemmatimonadaceae bacterium]|nr:hypothetical protein [Gemmatimonadaceae bacterium]
MTLPSGITLRRITWILPLGAALALSSFRGSSSSTESQQGLRAQVLLGRSLVLNHDCNGCHGGADPASDGWLAGMKTPDQEFLIGPCAFKTGATPCWHTRPRNLTPDNATGMGRFTERQIFNAIRYGLRPEDTPDVTITSMTPGKGNFPSDPHYLAPPMPWPGWRFMSDAEIQAIAAYLKHGLKPVVNKVADSEGPPDFWASEYTTDKIGRYPPPAFPSESEQEPK